MDGYLGYFFEHGGQIISFASAALLWLGFCALGAVLTGPERYQEATPIYGWALISFTFTALGVFTPIPFTTLAMGFGLLSIVAGVTVLRRGDDFLPPGTLKVVVLTIPLLLLVSAMVGSQWDEFGHWLMSPRQLLEIDTFPDHSNKHLAGSLPAYPYGWHFVTYLASRIAGRLVENAAALVNVFLLLSFGLVAVRLLREGQMDNEDEKAPFLVPGWGLLAVGGLAGTLLNPTFVQKIALTAYADVATTVTIGFGGVLGWKMLGALAAGDRESAKHLAWQVGLVMLVLVNLKQATVVLFAFVVGAIVLAGLRDSAIRFADLMRTLPAMLAPGIVIYLIWRFYVTTELSGAEMSIRPFDTWLIGYIPEILWKMIVVLSKKGAYLGLMAVATVFAVRGFICFKTPFDRLAVIVGAVFLGYNAFLFFVYVSTFGKFDGLRVASLWRYNTHLGMLGVAFAAYGLGILWKDRVPAGIKELKLAWIPIALIVVAPFVFVKKLRFDRQPPVPFYRSVGADLVGIIKPGDQLLIADPGGSGESGMITRYELHGIGWAGYISLYHYPTVKLFRKLFSSGKLTHMLVHSVTPPLAAASPVALENGKSYLLKSDTSGGWKIARTWKRP
ncbi:MAG: hypothetical protein O3B76_04045 [Proteobacteria bacterium]|nr:hypothetical protein [Pseudomonadota bacterium]